MIRSINARRLVLCACLALGALISSAAVAQVEFTELSPELDLRYRGLIDELRCVKCQNQSLADSNAPVAQDLRRIVREQLLAGANDEQIKQYLTDRYGEFVLYEPRLRRSTWLLWFGPLMFVLFGAAVVARLIARQDRLEVESVSPSDTDSDT